MSGMTKITAFTKAATLIACFAFYACQGSKKIEAYQCPMHDQIDTAYNSAGKCPVCGMDLEGIEKVDSTKIKILKIKQK